MPPKWRIQLGDEANEDLIRILEYTRDVFGTRQVGLYAETLRASLIALDEGPLVSGSTTRDDIRPGLRTLHVARKGRKGRHFIVYRAGAGAVIQVVRILHDAMDLARHVPTEDDDRD